MATIYLRLSTKSDKATSQHEVLLRFKHGKIDQRAKTNVFVSPEYWNSDQQTIIIPNWRLLTDEKKQIKEELQSKCDQLNQIISFVQSSFQALGSGKQPIAKDWLKVLIDGFNFPKDEKTVSGAQSSFFDIFAEYINERDFSLERKKHFWVVWRTLKRFELYKNTPLSFDTITDETLRTFEKFFTDEHIICKRASYQKILSAIPETRKPRKNGEPRKTQLPQPRGKNATNNFMRHLRAFIYWAIERDYTTNNPFNKYKIVECIYGTPIYITIKERNQIYKHDFSTSPRLSMQRDIFVFQCVIGCRVSDLWAMTKANIVNDAIEYIAQKTKKEDARTVRVPLNSIAKEIIDKYKDYNGKTLFPFTTQQHYNIDIKTIFRECGITRMVTVINPTTREEEKRPICEIASSHLARRCFIGNLYKQVKDPNLIAKLSGHKEGSKAFARYREIDEETSKELVKMLE